MPDIHSPVLTHFVKRPFWLPSLQKVPPFFWNLPEILRTSTYVHFIPIKLSDKKIKFDRNNIISYNLYMRAPPSFSEYYSRDDEVPYFEKAADILRDKHRCKLILTLINFELRHERAPTLCTQGRATIDLYHKYWPAMKTLKEQLKKLLEEAIAGKIVGREIEAVDQPVAEPSPYVPGVFLASCIVGHNGAVQSYIEQIQRAGKLQSADVDDEIFPSILEEAFGANSSYNGK